MIVELLQLIHYDRFIPLSRVSLNVSKRNAFATRATSSLSWNKTAVPIFKPKMVAGMSTATTPRLTHTGSA